jgi:cytochrome c-type biogenesis protein CcmF
VTVVCALLLPFVLGRWSALIALGLALALWVFASCVVLVKQRLAGTPPAGWVRKLRMQPASWYGMLLAHAGIAVFIVGVTLVKGYESERDVRMEAGDTTELAGYQFRFAGTTIVNGPNYAADRAQVEVTRNGKPVVTLHPEKRRFNASQMIMTDAAIDWGFTRDLYVAMGEPIPLGDGNFAWAVRIHHKPFVTWIWLGCLLMGLGAFCSAADKRYRALRSKAAAPAPLPANELPGVPLARPGV